MKEDLIYCPLFHASEKRGSNVYEEYNREVHVLPIQCEHCPNYKLHQAGEACPTKEQIYIQKEYEKIFEEVKRLKKQKSCWRRMWDFCAQTVTGKVALTFFSVTLISIPIIGVCIGGVAAGIAVMIAIGLSIMGGLICGQSEEFDKVENDWYRKGIKSLYGNTNNVDVIDTIKRKVNIASAANEKLAQQILFCTDNVEKEELQQLYKQNAELINFYLQKNMKH